MAQTYIYFMTQFIKKAWQARVDVYEYLDRLAYGAGVGGVVDDIPRITTCRLYTIAYTSTYISIE